MNRPRTCSVCGRQLWRFASDVYACADCDLILGVELPANRPDTQLQRDCDDIIGPWIDLGQPAPYDWETDHDLW